MSHEYALKKVVIPLTDDSKIVLYALVIDEFALLKIRHGNFGVTDAGRCGGHASSHPLHGQGGTSGSIRKVEHPAQRQGR